MNLIATTKGGFTFQLSAREKRALCQLLERYPLVPPGHHKLSRMSARPEDQQLLEQALAEHRTAQRRQVESLLKSNARFQRNKTGYALSLKPAQMEWLLQVLNDLRVGSWLALGSPDGPAQMYAALSEKSFPHFWTHELAGEFQMCLLQALSGNDHARPRE